MRVFRGVNNRDDIIDVFEDESDTDGVTFFDDRRHTSTKLSILHSSLRDWGGVCGPSSNIAANVGVLEVTRIHMPRSVFEDVYHSATRSHRTVPYFSVGDSVVLGHGVRHSTPVLPVLPGAVCVVEAVHVIDYCIRNGGISFWCHELDIEPVIAKAAPKCECGAAKCNSRIHSPWCPMA